MFEAQLPWPELTTDDDVIAAVLSGKRLHIPEHLPLPSPTMITIDYGGLGGGMGGGGYGYNPQVRGFVRRPIISRK